MSGAEAFAVPFRGAGWDVLICAFHADHLHLDTIFCMVSQNEAIACVDLLDDDFMQALAARGISVLPMPASLASSLGCNILALGRGHILADAADAVVTSTLTTLEPRPPSGCLAICRLWRRHPLSDPAAAAGRRLNQRERG